MGECTPLKKRACKKSPYCKWGGKSVRCAVALNACDAVQGKKMRKKCARVSTMQCLCSSQKKRGKCGTCVESLVGAPAPTPTAPAPACPSEWSWVNDVSLLKDKTVFTPQGLCAAIKIWNDNNQDNLFFGSDQSSNKFQLAAFLGNSYWETGQFRYGQENCNSAAHCGTLPYNTPCGSPGTCCQSDYGEYWGRGAIMVTCWQSGLACTAVGKSCPNYDMVVEQKFITSLSEKDKIATDPVAAWGSGIVFWMLNNGSGSQPAAKWVPSKNFGGTYQSINGACECDPEGTCQAKAQTECSGPPAGASGCQLGSNCVWNTKANKCMDNRISGRVDGFFSVCDDLKIDCTGWNTSICPGWVPPPPKGSCVPLVGTCGASRCGNDNDAPAYLDKDCTSLPPGCTHCTCSTAWASPQQYCKTV